MDLAQYYKQNMMLPRTQLAPHRFVIVKYYGTADLTSFECKTISRSSVVKHLCYDPKEKRVLVNLKGTYYHYCKVPSSVVSNWLSADSMGKFFDTHVKHNYGCNEFTMTKQ